MAKHEFEIPAHDLDAGGKSFTFPIHAAWLRGALEGHDVVPAETDGRLDVRASKSGTDVVVHGTVSADVTVPCARCLEPVAAPIRSKLSVMLVPAANIKGSKGMHDEYELTDVEADVMPYDGDLVVLDDAVRDEILLEIPMIPLCSEDCAGIRGVSSEGAADARPQSVDPRLMPLLRLKLQNERKNKE